jgi:hypothetical protein
MSLLSSLHAPGLRQISFAFSVISPNVEKVISMEVDNILCSQALGSIRKLKVLLFASFFHIREGLPPEVHREPPFTPFQANVCVAGKSLIYIDDF